MNDVANSTMAKSPTPPAMACSERLTWGPQVGPSSAKAIRHATKQANTLTRGESTIPIMAILPASPMADLRANKEWKNISMVSPHHLAGHWDKG